MNISNLSKKTKNEKVKKLFAMYFYVKFTILYNYETTTNIIFIKIKMWAIMTGHLLQYNIIRIRSFKWHSINLFYSILLVRLFKIFLLLKIYELPLSLFAEIEIEVWRWKQRLNLTREAHVIGLRGNSICAFGFPFFARLLWSFD